MERTAATLVTLAASVASAQQAPPNPTFFLDASQQVGAAVKDSVAGVEFGTLATAAAGAVKYWDLESATLTRSGGAMLTEGQAYTHAFCECICFHPRVVSAARTDRQHAPSL